MQIHRQIPVISIRYEFGIYWYLAFFPKIMKITIFWRHREIPTVTSSLKVEFRSRKRERYCRIAKLDVKSAVPEQQEKQMMSCNNTIESLCMIGACFIETKISQKTAWNIHAIKTSKWSRDQYWTISDSGYFACFPRDGVYRGFRSLAWPNAVKVINWAAAVFTVNSVPMSMLFSAAVHMFGHTGSRGLATAGPK